MKNILIFCLLTITIAFAQQRQRIAVLPSVGELEPKILDELTDVVREIVNNTLPKDNFSLLSQDNVIKMIGEEELFKACKEGTCIGELAKKANADYVARCGVNKVDEEFALKFELYSVKDEAILDIFTEYNVKNFSSMRSVLKKRLPRAFTNMIEHTGILEIIPSYKDGIGEYEQWNLTINNEAYSSFENRFFPGNYEVKLSHRCYEDISFKASINKDKYEVFSIAKHIKLKEGRLNLITEKNGDPIKEPVFANDKRIGKTPFNGKVPICSEISVGGSKEKININLIHNQEITYTHIIQEQRYEQKYERRYEPKVTYKKPELIYSHSRLKEPFFEIGWLHIWDMNHFRFSIMHLYGTFGAKENEIHTLDMEWIIGGIHRWVWKLNNSFVIGFGTFGGLGARHAEYEENCSNWYCNEKAETNFRHELGVEIILGIFSLYVAERNFYQMGGGIGLIF